MFTLWFMIAERPYVVSHYTSFAECAVEANRRGWTWWQWEVMHEGKRMIPGVNVESR